MKNRIFKISSSLLMILLFLALLLVYTQYRKAEKVLSNIIEDKIGSVYRATQMLASDRIFAIDTVESLTLAELEQAGFAMKNIMSNLTGMNDIANWYRISDSEMDDITFLYSDMVQYISYISHNWQAQVMHQDHSELSHSDYQKLQFIDAIHNLVADISSEFIAEGKGGEPFKVSSLEDYFAALHNAMVSYIETEYGKEFSILRSKRSILESLFD